MSAFLSVLLTQDSTHSDDGTVARYGSLNHVWKDIDNRVIEAKGRGFRHQFSEQCISTVGVALSVISDRSLSLRRIISGYLREFGLAVYSGLILPKESPMLEQLSYFLDPILDLPLPAVRTQIQTKSI